MATDNSINTTNHPDIKPNPNHTTKQHAVANIQLNIVTWVSEWVEFNAPPDTIQVISEAEILSRPT